MAFAIVLLACLVATALARPNDGYGAGGYSSGGYSAGGYKGGNDAGMPYNFDWNVNDGYGNNYNHVQKSDGKTTSGQYTVALPDGRIQTVVFKDDGYGLVADVQYTGEAKYPAPGGYGKSQYGGGSSYAGAGSHGGSSYGGSNGGY